MCEDKNCDVDYSGYVTKQILSIGHVLIQYRNRLFTPYGITGKQAMVLGFIIAKSNNESVITQNDIAKEFGLRPSSINSLLGYLEYRGFIERNVSPNDARAKIVNPSENATRIFNSLTDCFYTMEDNLLKGFSEDEAKQIKDLLTRIYSNINEI